MRDTTIVGIDVGRSAVKAFAYAEGEKFPLVFPSLVAPAIAALDEESAHQLEPETVTIKSGRFYTGEAARLYGGAEHASGLTSDWVHNDDYEILLRSAIKRFGAMGVPGLDSAYLVVGTPSDLFAAERTSLEKRTADICGLETRSLSQPLGVYLSHVLSEIGTPVIDRHRDENGRRTSYAVVEVGEFDTGFMIVKEGVHQVGRDDIGPGISEAVRNLQIALRARKHRLSLVECNEALRTRQIKVFGQYEDITNDVLTAIAPVINKIVSKATMVIGNDAKSIDGILLAGGGAYATYHPLRDIWNHVVILENPRMSVAEGYLRYAKSVMLKRMRQHSGNEMGTNNAEAKS
ncbi:ParM/StbA family protein [Noviherbaspirillum pedocola]|uniref:ParM/StbA family protein n=1 Tax=Noviherbaspirillum pedocola TaxID=2801341 RepID=A0A934W2A0_9BURK|nr:ParM/StbA family protein [Noviherbaspirillum pedocola]MBK4736091.1 ParM/StbA family protein [Noviherbaspirillum pedocola]